MTINKNYKFNIKFNKKNVFIAEMSDLHGKWSETSYQLQALRDNPECAKQEYESITNHNDPGIFVKIPFEIEKNTPPRYKP